MPSGFRGRAIIQGSLKEVNFLLYDLLLSFEELDLNCRALSLWQGVYWLCRACVCLVCITHLVVWGMFLKCYHQIVDQITTSQISD